MSVTKPKKARRYRGSKTHGGGSMKKRRGAGHRGGRGRAGSGKRGDAKKPSYWKTWTMGAHGFVPHDRERLQIMNLSDLERYLPDLEKAGFAKKASGGFSIDLTAAGIDKLLGTGSVSQKFAITVDAASAKAVDRVSAAGGSVSVKEKVVKAKKAPSKKKPADDESEE